MGRMGTAETTKTTETTERAETTETTETTERAETTIYTEKILLITHYSLLIKKSIPEFRYRLFRPIVLSSLPS